MNLFESILAIILKFTKTKLCSETCKTRKAEAQSIYSSRKKTITVWLPFESEVNYQESALFLRFIH